MSSISEALKRAQQDRERLRNPGNAVAEEVKPAATEPSLAAVVLKRTMPVAPPVQAAVPAAAAMAESAKEAGLAGVMNLSAGAGAAQRAAPAAATFPPWQAPTTLTNAMKQAPQQTAPAVRNEQRHAETIVEDYASKRRLNLPLSMVVYHDRAGPVAEQYRKTRDNLMAMHASAAGRRETQVLVLTSAVPGEGKTVTAVNLGLSLVEVRANRVLLIDGCLQNTRRRPSLTELLRLQAEKGLAELLAAPLSDAAAMPVEELLKATPWHNLFVLPAGARTSPAAAAALLQSPGLRAVVRKVRANFDWILIDAPAAGALPDAGLLGACSDGMLLTVALHRTAHEKVQATIRRLRSMNLPVKSCIMTRA